MAKRAQDPAEVAIRPPKRKLSASAGPDVVHTSAYLPRAMYEGLRQVAFRERCKIHQIMLEGIDMALRKRQSSAKTRGAP
jgi:hypothetical protein